MEMRAKTQVVLKWSRPKVVIFSVEVFSPNDALIQVDFSAEIEE